MFVYQIFVLNLHLRLGNANLLYFFLVLVFLDGFLHHNAGVVGGGLFLLGHLLLLAGDVLGAGHIECMQTFREIE